MSTKRNTPYSGYPTGTITRAVFSSSAPRKVYELGATRKIGGVTYIKQMRLSPEGYTMARRGKSLTEWVKQGGPNDRHRAPITHELKTEPPYFEQVMRGDKTFEIRYKDRDYRVHDLLDLREYDGTYTGRNVTVKVTYITNYQQRVGYVVMAIKQIPTTPTNERGNAKRKES